MFDYNQGIYSLSDPSTGLIYYVGSSRDLLSRKNHHQRAYSDGTIVSEKNRAILDFGLIPIFEILEYTPYSDKVYLEKVKGHNFMRSMEIYWISQISAWGFDLLNSNFTKNQSKNRNYFNY